jgi:hypothetical protein
VGIEVVRNGAALLGDGAEVRTVLETALVREGGDVVVDAVAREALLLRKCSVSLGFERLE